MLDAMRRGAQSLIARGLFLILVVAFAIWGIPHDLLTFGGSYLAKVGSQEISAARFQQDFQNQLQTLSEQSRQRVTTEQALALGLDRSVLERLIGQSALAAEAAKLKLALSQDTLIAGIKSDPAFAGPDGKFSRGGFQAFLNQIGMSERGFFAVRQEDELRRQLTGAMAGATVVPAALAEIMHAYSEETRALSHFVIDPDKAVTIADPDEAALKTTYDQNQSRFMSPETRKLALLFLSIDDLKNGLTIGDDELKAAYEDSKSSYDKPERRRIQQIPFKDKAAADQARKAIVEDKKNFMDVAKEAGASENDVNLGMLSEQQMIDPAIAAAAFKLARDEVSLPIEGRFATVLLRVIEIEPGQTNTFDTVKDQVRERLATKKAEGMLHERVDLVEEARNAGKSLKEAGESLKLPYLDVDNTTKDNKTADGKTAIDRPAAAAILNEAFAGSVGEQSDPVDLGGSGYAWFDVLAVTPSALKPFDSVKEEAKALFIDIERGKKLEELAKTLVERLQKGEDIAKVAEEVGGKVVDTPDIKRKMPIPDLGAGTIRQAFSLKKGEAGQDESADHKSRVVFKVNDIIAAPPLAKEETDKISAGLARDMEADQLISFVEGLKARLGVSINEKLLKRVTGAETQ